MMKLFRKKIDSELRACYVLDKFVSCVKGGDFLEVGCGKGAHVEYIKQQHIFDTYTCIDLNNGHNAVGHITGDFERHKFNEQFDAIWCSHVLEHTRNPGIFLDKIHSILKEGGLLALNIPPLKHQITTGHLTLWNPGLLLLNMIRAGFDCSQVKVCQQGYNIGLILEKKTCPPSYGFSPDTTNSDREYLPHGLKWFQKKSNKVWYFKGNFSSLNWD